MVSFCKSCQQNNVNTRVEWRPNPFKPGKNKQYDIDKDEWHNCPYWKPDPNYKSKPKPNPLAEASQEFEQQENQKPSIPKNYQEMARDIVELSGWRIKKDNDDKRRDQSITDLWHAFTQAGIKSGKQIADEEEVVED